MSSIDIQLNRVDRIFRPNETVHGSIILNASSAFTHQGITLQVEGTAKLQLSAKSVGIFDAFYNSVKPLELVSLYIPIEVSGQSVRKGVNKFPFEFVLTGINKSTNKLYESYHGVYVSVTYEIRCDCARRLMQKNLHRSLEFIVEAPLQEPLTDAPKVFNLTPEILQNIAKKPIKSMPTFKISGKVHRTNCPINLPFTGEIVIEHAASLVKSIELQLIRVESIAHAEGVARDATEIQNVQLGWGDVCRELVIPIYMIFPRLFTCPTMLTHAFKVQFEVNIVILFDDGYMITENFPINLYR